MNVNPDNSIETAAREYVDKGGEDAAQRFQQQMALNPAPVYMPNTQIVDMTSLAKAQGLYIVNLTRWVLQNNQFGTPEFIEELGSFSKAQTDYIAALQISLHQIGVL
jgi:hypothetical protein